MVINGWEILLFKIFYDQYLELTSVVKSLRDKNPTGYKSHPKTKLLAKIQFVIKEDVPADPLHKKFMLSKTLTKHKEWRRVKKGLPPRYRLFFRFYSGNKNIIFAWMNDGTSIRKEGDKYDVYNVFLKLLKNRVIPNQYEELLSDSHRHFEC